MKALRVVLGILLVSAAATAAPAQVRICITGSTIPQSFVYGLKDPRAYQMNKFERISNAISLQKLPDGSALQTTLLIDSRDKTELAQWIQQADCDYIFALTHTPTESAKSLPIGLMPGKDGSIHVQHDQRHDVGYVGWIENLSYDLKRAGTKKSIFSGLYTFDTEKFAAIIAADKARAQRP